MMNYTVAKELQELQMNNFFSDMEEAMEVYREMQEDEYKASQQIQTGTIFDVSVKLDPEAESQKIYIDGEQQCLLIYQVTVSIPKSDNDTKNQINIDSIKKVLEQEGTIREISTNDCDVQFMLHRGGSDYYSEIKELFELKDEMINLLNPTLQCLEVKKCNIEFYVDAYWHN